MHTHEQRKLLRSNCTVCEPQKFQMHFKKAKLGIPVSKFGGVHLEHSCHQTVGHDLENFRGFLNSWLSEQNDGFKLADIISSEK